MGFWFIVTVVQIFIVLFAANSVYSFSVGIDISDVPSNSSYDTSIQLLKYTGASTTSLAFQWNQIEQSPNNYTDPNGLLSITNYYYPANNISISLCIRAIDTVVTPFPTDLSPSVYFIDDPIVITRYSTMLLWTLNQINKVNLVNLIIANEVDANQLSKQNQFWDRFSRFVNGVIQIVEKQFKINIGFTVTSGGLLSEPLASNIIDSAVNAKIKIIGVTIYGINQDFSVWDPTIVNIKNVLKQITNKIPSSLSLSIQELGIPSSNNFINFKSSIIQDLSNDNHLLSQNSSVAYQINYFLSSFYTVWNESLNISFINIVRLYDVSLKSAQQTAIDYGLAGNNNFIEYIRTLGLLPTVDQYQDNNDNNNYKLLDNTRNTFYYVANCTRAILGVNGSINKNEIDEYCNKVVN